MGKCPMYPSLCCVSCDVNGQGVISAETQLPADVMQRVREAVRQSAVAAAESGRHARPSASISSQRRASTPGTTQELTSVRQYKVFTDLTCLLNDDYIMNTAERKSQGWNWSVYVVMP